jgi:hypothetical protein
MELLSGHEKITTESGISPNAGTLNRGFTVFSEHFSGSSPETVSLPAYIKKHLSHQHCKYVPEVLIH